MARAHADDPADLPFLLTRSDPTPASRVLRNLLASLGVHVAVGTILLSLPEVIPPPAPVIVANIHKPVTLVAPRFFNLTQKDPNQGKVTRSLDVRSANVAPLPQAPRVVPSSPPPGPPIPAPPVVVPPPQIAPQIEAPPQVQVATGAPIPGDGTAPQPLPPPKPAPDKPKIQFESLASANLKAPIAGPPIAAPKNTIQELTRAATRPPGAGGVVVGDDLNQPPNIGQPGQAPIPGKMGSNLQLLSDPNGIDFKPYLVQVLSAVRHNWMTVIPESGRLGLRRGVVQVQFIIDREGRVPKLVIATPSGTDAFDRAAVAGISMTNPFPPLPASYKGSEIRLQLAFSYNMSR